MKTHRQIVHELLSDLVREDVHAKRVALRQRILFHLPIEDPDAILAQTGSIEVRDHKLVLADEAPTQLLTGGSGSSQGTRPEPFSFKMPKI